MKGKGNDGSGDNKERDGWETSKELFNKLDKQYKFKFDCCATKDNTKCENFSNDFKESEILDIEEFESHKKDYNYSDFFIKNSLEAIEQVKELKNNKNFWRLFK